MLKRGEAARALDATRSDAPTLRSRQAKPIVRLGNQRIYRHTHNECSIAGEGVRGSYCPCRNRQPQVGGGEQGERLGRHPSFAAEDDRTAGNPDILNEWRRRKRENEGVAVRSNKKVSARQVVQEIIDPDRET